MEETLSQLAAYRAEQAKILDSYAAMTPATPEEKASLGGTIAKYQVVIADIDTATRVVQDAYV